MQFLLSCGLEVTIYSQVVGYGRGDSFYPSPFLSSNSFFVESWKEGQEDLFFEAQVKEEFQYI